MPQQDLYIGLGSMAYALAKMDGRLQPEELTTLRQVLHDEPYGEIAISMINLNDKYSVEAGKALNLRPAVYGKPARAGRRPEEEVYRDSVARCRILRRHFAERTGTDPPLPQER